MIQDTNGVHRLHIGGTEPKDGWKILNIQPGDHVDFVGSCTDLSRFRDGSIEEIYASHVLEHLDYQCELPRCLTETYRVLTPNGRLLVSVPDLAVLCKLFCDPNLSVQHRFQIMRMIMGGQTDAFDFHKSGFSYEIAQQFAARAGYRRVQTVNRFGLFNDMSNLAFLGHPISLNLIFYKKSMGKNL